jgi:hypothetical protein
MSPKSQVLSLEGMDDEPRPEYVDDLLDPKGYDPYFMRNVEPQKDFPHLRPALPPPPKVAKGYKLYNEAHHRRVVSRAGSLFSRNGSDYGSRPPTRVRADVDGSTGL